jgi:hypothetical protein
MKIDTRYVQKRQYVRNRIPKYKITHLMTETGCSYRTLDSVMNSEVSTEETVNKLYNYFKSLG